jgi:L-fuculose-phosphate aldolase
MLLEATRREIAAAGRRMLADRLVTGTAGNISVRDPESGYVAITPTGVPYERMRAEHVTVVDLEGKHVEGIWHATSELAMHCAVYRLDPLRHAVVHTHSMYATSFAVCGRAILAVHYNIADIGTSIKAAPYATYGTEELARSALDTMGADNAVLLRNHGVLAVGPTLVKAYARAMMVEYLAELNYRALQLGAPTVLTEAEILRVQEKFKRYGQPAHRRS